MIISTQMPNDHRKLNNIEASRVGANTVPKREGSCTCRIVIWSDLRSNTQQFNINWAGLVTQFNIMSADTFLGLPFNIASYALLTHMFAQQCDLGVGEFIWTGGDTHLYHNHGDQARLQLSREPYPLPKLVIKRKPESIFGYKIEDFELVGYQHHPAIKAPVAV